MSTGTKLQGVNSSCRGLNNSWTPVGGNEKVAKEMDSVQFMGRFFIVTWVGLEVLPPATLIVASSEVPVVN